MVGFQAIVDIFAWDPEEEADEWWQAWGLMQERAAHRSLVGAWVGVDVEVEEEERRSRSLTPAYETRHSHEGVVV